SNTQPLQNIGINETFTAGDFPVTIKQVSGSNGRFRGVGYIVVPYLADTKLAVSFTNICINTDYQLIEGVVSTTYDTTWGDVESADEFIDGLGDLIDEIEETVNTLFENGEITSEEKEDALGQLNEATTNLQGAAEQQNQADEKKQQAEKAESPEKEKLQEEAEKLEKESKETQQEVNKALNELQNKFGVKGKDGGLEIKTDAFFDGVISYGKGKNVITHKRLDGNGEISINTTDSNNNIPDTSDYNFIHNGKQYNVIVTHSNSTIEAINDAKDKAVNPSTGIVIYFHYDLEKENLGYTVNFAPDYFDNLPNQDFLEVQELHKEALLNLLKQLQSSEDIINVIYNNVLEINTLFQESLNKIQLPETIWNPDAENYTNNDFHFEPLEAGLIDGAIEEIKSIPLLISLVVDYSTNPKTREKINKAFSDFDFTNAMNKWYESRKDLYTSGTIHKIEHRTGKDVVEVGTLIGTGGLTTLGKIKKGADLVEGVTSAIKKVAKEGGEALSFLEKSKLFIKGENALLRYSRKDGTFFMHKSPSNPNLTTGYSNELTFSFKYKSGSNANSKDVFGKIGVTDEGYIVGNLRKPTGMNNQQIKGVTEDAMDMALHHFGKNKVKGIKALWVKNADLYPNMVGNKSINLSKFEKALETMDKSKAVFHTVTGTYAKSRNFTKVIEVKKLEEAIDGVYGYEVIFGTF
ncbi:ATP synthase F0 subunit B, partial [Tenacibaculum maritimum]|uniref:ATP synthase F0 subunit B n=3 Tax=Tenacibaculum maritimum TaxID=107401 RepID=UPI0019166FDF